MKSIKNSFLFFCICFFLNSNIFSQPSVDSTRYYYDLIINPKSNYDLISGYTFFNSLKEKHLFEKDTLKAIYDLRMIVFAQNSLELPYESESSIVEALNLIDNIKEIDSSLVRDRMSLAMSLGNIYLSLKEYDKALNIYNESLEASNDYSYSLTTHLNIGNIFAEQGKFQLAESKYRFVYKERLKFDDTRKIAHALDNWGYVKVKLGNIEGFEDMLNALEMRKKVGESRRFYISYKHLSESFKDIGDLKKARYYAGLGYNEAVKYGDSYEQDALLNLLKLSEDSLVIKYAITNERILNKKLLIENKYASSKYNLSKEQQKALENQLLMEKEKTQKIRYQMGGILVLVLSVFFYFMLKSRYKKRRLLEIYNTETRISKKVHDEVANDVYHVMTKLQHDSDLKEDVLDDLEHIYEKTRDISKENTAIDVEENFGELLNDLLSGFKQNEVSIITRDLLKMNWESLTEIEKTMIYRVVQELMVNMKKHSKASIVIISFKELRGKKIIEYKDNGVGCNLKKQGGLLNTENRMRSINGTINFESEINNGFKATIKV